MDIKIRFKEQSQYEKNKGFIKDIIKRKFKLSVWDSIGQAWFGSGITGIVKRITENEKTVGLDVSGNDALASFLSEFCSKLGATVEVVREKKPKQYAFVGADLDTYSHRRFHELLDELPDDWKFKD